MLMKVAHFVTWVKCRVASVPVWPAAVLCPRGWEKDGANISPEGWGCRSLASDALYRYCNAIFENCNTILDFNFQITAFSISK